jgi:hypothetical protein
VGLRAGLEVSEKTGEAMYEGAKIINLTNKRV